jgi:hypothetical protein
LRSDWAAAALVLALASIAPAQVGILQIKILEGEGGVYAPGAHAARPLTVEVTDETGRPVAGAAVSFHLPEDGPSGIFVNGLRTEVVTADERGRAVLRSMQLNRVPGRFQVRIIASKEQATAGTVSFQYIADPTSGAAIAGAGNRKTREPSAVSAGSHGHKKWILILAAGAGGAAAAFLARRSGGSTASGAGGATGNNPTPIPTTIGAPSITVGKP